MGFVQGVILISLLMNIVMWLMGVIYSLVILGTCGVGCLLLPFYLAGFGYLSLLGVAAVGKGLLTVNVPFWWQGLILSLVLGMVRIPTVSLKSSTSEQ